ncbi:MAG: hypothetical protein COV70_00185 [Parcubacteria group bacterium CG11_big_fil_rev_8_21_14_0_20_39_22]|nr:MAG: hypothetical protein COV70_00185 [Parcubacteria group bacterium CG11_big_fil_rev_8_21_14_0_20_39_22]
MKKLDLKKLFSVFKGKSLSNKSFFAGDVKADWSLLSTFFLSLMVVVIALGIFSIYYINGDSLSGNGSEEVNLKAGLFDKKSIEEVDRYFRERENKFIDISNGHAVADPAI